MMGYQAALGQPQWRNEGHQPGSLEMDTSGHSKATVKKKTSRKAASMCPTLPDIAACLARKIRLLRRQRLSTKKCEMCMLVNLIIHMWKVLGASSNQS